MDEEKEQEVLRKLAQRVSRRGMMKYDMVGVRPSDAVSHGVTE